MLERRRDEENMTGCDMEKFGALDSSEKTIAIPGRQVVGHRRPKRKEIR